MKKLKFIIFPFITLIVVLSGCTKEKDPLDQEQYIKQVYIVSANKSNNEGLSTIKLAYSKSADEEQVTNISVAASGSQGIDRNIAVSLVEAGNENITRYNALYRYSGDIKYQKLNPSFYRIPEKTVQIKSGEIYATMPLYVKTASLHCDSLYAVTVKIASVSEPDYISIRKTDTVLMVSFAMTNDYSGVTQVQGKYYKLVSGPLDTISVGLSRTLNAVNYNTVRFYHLATVEGVNNAAASGVKVTVGDDNSLTIMPWGNLAITSGGGTYNPNSRSFDVWYNYKESGVSYQFKGTFKRGTS